MIRKKKEVARGNPQKIPPEVQLISKAKCLKLANKIKLIKHRREPSP